MSYEIYNADTGETLDTCHGLPETQVAEWTDEYLEDGIPADYRRV